MVYVLEFYTPKPLTKWHMQIMKTKIRLPLKGESESLIRVYSFCHSTNCFKRWQYKKAKFSLKTFMLSSVGELRTFTIHVLQFDCLWSVFQAS